MTDPSPAPHARCPNCSTDIPLADFVSDGFLRSRDSRSGGPYYELECPEERCESVLVLERDADGTRVVSMRGSGRRGRQDSKRQRFPRHLFDEETTAGPRATHRTDGRSEESGRDGASRDRGRDRFEREESTGSSGRRRESPPPHSDSDEPSLDECRTLLGVEATADQDAIKSAFREKSKRMHPDRFAEFDADFQRLAHEKFIRLKQARDRLLSQAP